MTESAGSPMPSGKRITRAAVVTHGKAGQIGAGLARLQAVAQEHGVELVLSEEEALKHGVDATDEAVGDLAVGLGRVFAGEYDVVELPTLELQHPDGSTVAVNDVVVSSASLGRMIELELAVGAEELGRQPCDGIICSTPSGSTAYNLSNGGPVLMWGLDAMATTFVAPHSLHARPLVVPRGKDVVVWNRTPDVPVVVLVDGHRVGEAPPGGRVTVRLGDAHTLLATLPDATFVSRYRAGFST